MAGPAGLREPAGEEMEFSSDSSMGSESEVEITEASGPQTVSGPRRKTRRTVKKIPLSKAGLTVAECATRSSTPRGASKVRGASAPPDTGEVGLAAAGLQTEKEEEAPQCNTRFIKEHKQSNHIRARIKSHVYTTE